ncbi:MAG: hypothetical protein JSR16_07430 [Proteobacteria bacterium]|nr:hypothetical protein [Pseudomonadota bacterium]
MIKIFGELDLSQIADEQFQPGLELRVAVAHEGSILGSTIINPREAKERRLPFELAFVPPVLPGAHRPCPVTVLAGPNVSDRELLAIDTVRQMVDPAPPRESGAAKAAAAPVAQLKLGSVVVDSSIYQCWLVCCRTYTINGRIVCRHWHYDPRLHRWSFCDEPVPGATVEAWDVDRFWWWYWRDQVSSATTDINGNFHMHFRWCCLRWLPWLRQNPVIDPDILARIQHLLTTVEPPLPPLPPGPDPDPTMFQQWLGGAANLPGPVLAAATHGALSLPAVQQSVATASAEVLRARLPTSPELAALHVWPWWNWGDCAPDIVFRATQRCGDRVNVIYQESNAQTRWDIPTTLNVTLIANDLACCIPSCRDPECPECLKLTWVACTPVDQISADAGPPFDLRGYARTGAAATDPWKDNPFFGSLQIRGGLGWDVDYFKVQVSKDGAPWADLPTPAFGGYTRSYWDGSAFVPVAFTPAPKNGQMVIITRRHYEDTHPAIPRFGGQVIWNDYDTLFYFDTTQPGLTPDALYQLQCDGFAADAADNLIAASERILPTCGTTTAERVYLRIDNQGQTHPAPTLPAPCKIAHACGGIIHACTVEPDCYIREIWKNEGLPDQECVSACDIARLAPTDTLTIHFSVTCPATLRDGHLGGYWLRAEFGANQAFYIAAPLYVDATGGAGVLAADPTAEFGPSYSQALGQGAPRAHWYGGDFKVMLHGADFPECCAYLLRLWAWKRSTNGCSDPSVTHYNQFELSFTVLRPDLCPGVCPPPRGAGDGGNLE